MFSMFVSLHISFQEFKNRPLELGLVDRIVVSNKSVAKVFSKKKKWSVAKVYVRDLPRDKANDDVIQGPVNGALA